MEAVREIQSRFNTNHIYARNVLVLAQASENTPEVSTLIAERPKPFVKWIGGKRQLLKQFRDLGLYPPEHFDLQNSTYFEPFVGGGAVFFDLLPRRAQLSDLNLELVTTYNVIKNNVEELISSLKKHKNEKEYFLKTRSLKISKLNSVQVASRFIYLNRTCFNGIYRVNSRGEFNVPYVKNKYPLICDEINLRKVSKALQNVEIKHQDYKKALKSAKKGDFIYLDPPYHPLGKAASFTAYTKESFSEKDQTELRDLFLELHRRGCFIMLSNSDAPFVNEIYGELKGEGVTIHKVHAGRVVNSKISARGKVKEVVVTNY